MGSVQTQIRWDQGTAYDFIASLVVLHFPDKFGLRGAWAAGVRSRIPGVERDFLEEVVRNFQLPLRWVYSLSSPKDASTVLLSLKQIPPAERITALQMVPVDSPALEQKLNQVKEQRAYTPEDLEDVVRLWRKFYKEMKVVEEEVVVAISRRRAEIVLNFFANPEDFGERYLQTLTTYYQVFFAEEEKRIASKLEHALSKAQKFADKFELVDLLNKLLDGDWDQSILELEELILVPSYWYSPWSLTSCLQPERTLMLYGSRPKEESLVPGEIVPEELVLKLKAMTDPTRLRILRYLMQEQLTPAELARRLRLRAPTVTHHLHSLKLAGMVHFVMRGKHEHLYFAKMDSIKGTYSLLKEFLEQDVSIAEGLNLLDDDRLY
jgi:DNA-binding transcriptional ArsR family regulator